MTAVVPYSQGEDDEPGHELVPTAVQSWLETRGGWPTWRQVKLRAKWYLRVGLPRHALPLFLMSPLLLLKELRPVAAGAGKAVAAWSTWCGVAESREAISHAEGNTRANRDHDWQKRRSGRRWMSAFVVLLLSVAGVVAYYKYPYHLAAAGIVLLGIFDLVGRAGREPAEKTIHFPTSGIAEGMSLGSLRTQLENTLIELEGFDPDGTSFGMPLPIKDGWRVAYHSRQAIEDQHLRNIERTLQVRRNGIVQIREAGNAARGELWITLKDPLANVLPSPELPELTIFEKLPLGVDADHQTWEEGFLRTHFTVVGKSQSGKSSLFWQIIYVLRRCREVELDAIDLTDGPCFSACFRAFRKRATDEDGAKEVLTDAVDLIKARASELSRLAEDDDTPDEFDEKHQPTAELPQRTILVDEAARVTENKDLLPLVEYILRYGAKAAVSIGLAGQGGGLDDFGSSIVRGMAMLKIVLACSRQDVLSIFGKDARDEGYRPDLLQAAQGRIVNDAGKCYVQSASSQSPKMRRVYRLEQSDVRRRDREMGRPNRPDMDAIEAVEVPPLLAAVEGAFIDAGEPEFLPSRQLLAALRHDGFDTLDESGLGSGLGKRVNSRRKRVQGFENAVACYFLADVRAEIRRLG